MTDIDLTTSTSTVVFTFGEPLPVLDRNISEYYQSLWNGRWYEPPVSFDALAKALGANAHHGSAIRLKAQILTSCFTPHRLLSRPAFHRLALDILTFGNAFLERRRNWLGQPLELAPTLTRWTRRRKDGGCLMLIEGREHEFQPGEILHLMEPDVSQEIYGVPGYLAAMQSAFLNEAATLFRRKYYINGSHAGFIMYVTDPAQNQEDIDNIRTALKESKGVGNFKNLFFYSPNGRPDGIKIIPIAEVMAKDEFFNIKNVTRDDVLAAHRVPPQLLGVPPSSTGGFGDVEKAAAVFARNELLPLMTLFGDINAWMGEDVVRFRPYEVAAAAK